MTRLAFVSRDTEKIVRIVRDPAEAESLGTRYPPSAYACVTMSVGATTEHERTIYTQGGCAVLAAALWRISRWPVVAIAAVECCCFSKGHPDPTLCLSAYAHFMVEDPDGRLWDVAGPHDPDAMMAIYQESMVIRRDIAEDIVEDAMEWAWIYELADQDVDDVARRALGR